MFLGVTSILVVKHKSRKTALARLEAIFALFRKKGKMTESSKLVLESNPEIFGIGIRNNNVRWYLQQEVLTSTMLPRSVYRLFEIWDPVDYHSALRTPLPSEGA